ncbi:hypothetical protein Rsub_11648 [Raphidocelis subcapitata]|uniref:Uncharacterized protein n=1 Tax=Raphidocelis subcapitata TaxID=307507 RepID=A0A2V0PFM9_9CHLO|nr:hypothetical protein Rsub_11648 [Raphidocelis subcapitata]|eukprot:GBF98654.1 hypothetical protein Rsub_11648 [Raphidocelis subcapitata]
MARLAVACLLLLAGAQFAAAYPSLWATESDVKCPDHPKKKEHGHGAPQIDSAITFSVADASGKAVKAVCPGQTYTVTVGFPEPRLALLTSDVGKFTASSGKSDTKCPSRQVFDKSQAYTPSKAQVTQIALPCGRTTPVMMMVTSAKGEYNNFMQASSTLPLDTGCKAC